MKAKDTAGNDIEIEHEDMGDSVPYFNRHGMREEAYTSMFRIKRGGKVEEIAVQVERWKERRNDMAELRTAEAKAVLESAGVDVASLKDWFG